MWAVGIGGAAFGILLGFIAAVRADDQPFLTVYTTDIDTQYEKEVEQSFYWSTQKPLQAFNGYVSRSEFEYGVTDDFHVSGYFNYESDRTHPHPPIGPDPPWNAKSVSGAPVYRFHAYYFGPTISYVGLPFTVLFGAQFQMPWASSHTDAPGIVQSGYLTDAERTRLGFRIKMDLP